MQHSKKHSSLLLLLVMACFTSCEGLIESILDEELYSDSNVTTFYPEVNSENVVFRGEVNGIPRGKEVEFGFMWFKANEDNAPVHRVMLGKRSTDGEFATSITTLPRNENLVVCAFILESEPVEFETIGEERDFSWRL